MNGTRMSKYMWANVMVVRSSLGCVQVARVAADDLIDPETREGAAALGREDRSCGCRVRRSATNELLQKVGRLLPQGTDAPLIAFSVQAYPRLRSKLQVLNSEVGYFLHSATGVVQQPQECPIAEGEAALGR